MRVRIRREPDESRGWRVEKKENFFCPWAYVTFCLGDDAKERALQTANLIMNPEIIEVKKL